MVKGARGDAATAYDAIIKKVFFDHYVARHHRISSLRDAKNIAWVSQNYPDVQCRAISAKFMSDQRIAMFELAVHNDAVKVKAQRYYKLLPGPAEPVLGVWDSELVWALAGKTSIAPKVATLRKRQFWKADRRIPLAPLPQNRVRNAFPAQKASALA